ncbi:MAG: right-handed parallel beta-helix repeat-containing protein [Candidatus Hydrogenedentes bacterium]|nr:right-handed parallel beta-helix repeat-containing protein [Candidatus Hydrogenedentota bacterium]
MTYSVNLILASYVILSVFLWVPAVALPAPTAASFGATGDGMTDDTAALQRAVDAGGPLVLDPGTYRLTAPLIIHLNADGYMGITGASGTARLLMEGAGPALYLIGTHGGTASPATVKPAIWDRERFPIISDLEIVGAHEEADGICLEGTMNCTISRVLIRNCLHGIHLIKRNRNFILSDSHLYENKITGVFLDRVNLHQIIIVGNHISYSGSVGIHVLGGEVRNIQITGNDIEYNDDAEANAADVLFDTREGTLREFTICSNTIQAVPSPGGANIRILGTASAAADRSGLGSISGNIIGSQTVNIDLQHTRGVTISGNSIYSAAELSLRVRSCRNLTVTGNNIDYNPSVENRMRDGIFIESCKTVLISGNTLADCRWGTAEQGGAITLVDSQHALISNCIIMDPAVRGIHLINCTSCRVTNNIIQDTREPRRMIEAIAVSPSSEEISILDNTIPKIEE